jgi:hypothetical protein
VLVPSLARTLDHVTGDLADLASAAALADIRRIAGLLPAALSRCLYFERWLDEEARLDFIVRVDASARAILADEDPQHRLDERLASQSAWQRLRSFARAWPMPAAALDGLVEALWLEFDRPPGPETDPASATPRVFLDFARAGYAQDSTDRRLDLALRALRALRGDAAGRRNRQALRRCLESLPPEAYLVYLGLAVGSEDGPVRVCVRGLTDAGLVAYLESIGWPGDVSDLSASVLEPLARVQGRPARSVAIVHVDLDERVGPRIGLEYAFSRRRQLRGGVAETGMLDHLVRRGWCGAAARDGLLRWPGRSVELLSHEIWYCRLARRLSHVKLTCSPAEPVAAKGYLRFSHDLVGEGTLLGTRPLLFGAGRGAPAPTDGARVATPPVPRPKARTPARRRAMPGSLRSRAPDVFSVGTLQEGDP